MKTPGNRTLILFVPLFTLCCSFVTAQIDSEHKEKATKIIQWVAAGKPLPKNMHYEFVVNVKPHRQVLSYKTNREDAKVHADSVMMSVMADDSLMDLEFNEDWYNGGESIKGYHYNIQKGEITWAYNYGPSLKSVYHVSLKQGDSIKEIDSSRDSSYIIDKKDTAWTYSKQERIANDARNKRSALIFEPMLKKSIDEVHGMLFNKK